jgi:putative salt-induced outer membrane protein YdiY
MTNLESLANLGEIIGAVTVVVSLIYLAVQVRQNTQAQQTENFSRALDRVASIQATLSQDPEMSVIFSKGVSDPSDLTSRERMQFTWTMYELFGAFEFMFFVSKANATPEEIWQRWSSAGKADSFFRKLHVLHRNRAREQPDRYRIHPALPAVSSRRLGYPHKLSVMKQKSWISASGA